MSAPAPAAGVRRAVARDLDQVVALWSGLVAQHVALDDLFALRPGAEGEMRRVFAAQLRDPDTAIFVCDGEGSLAGFCGVRIDRAPPLLRESARGEITDLAVREGVRRCGIGTALVAAAQAWIAARGVARVEVRVATRNSAGQAFWRALGYGDLMDVLQRRL